jgi:hypothetical protein
MKRLMMLLPVLAVTAACGDSLLDPSAATFDQVDHMGRPAIATVFLPSSQKDAFNAATPSQHRATFKTFVTGFLTSVAGYTAGDADALADVLLPDLLTIDLDAASGYLNGRRPQDDVTTASLMLVFGSGTGLSDDHVDANDKAYPTTFPYLATPHLP